MTVNRPLLALLVFTAFALCLLKSEAQQSASLDTTNNFPPPESKQVGGSESLTGAKVQVDKSPYEIEADSFKLEFLGDYRRILNGDYQALPGGGFAALAAVTDLDSFGLSLEGGAVQLNPGSIAAANIANPRFIETGLVLRHYFTPSHVFFRPYMTFNANYFLMAWDYRTPINFNDGTSLNGDSAEGVDLSASAGLAIRLSRHANLFGEFNGGGVAMLPFTEGGIDNNFMGSFGYLGVKAGLTVVF